MRKISLRKRVEIAEKRERDARRRMKDMDVRMRKANAISDGSMIFVTVLAAKIGDVIHLTADEIEANKHKRYVVKRNPDGSMDMVLEELLGCEMEHEG